MSLRIVAMADTHLFHEEDPFPVPDGDILIHAGDLCRRGTLHELERAVLWLRSLPHPFKVLVAGNHDWSFVRHPTEARGLLGSDFIYLEDSGATVLGLQFWGSPWQPEFGGWAFNLPRGAALAEKWALIPPTTDVLITHGPPAGFGDRTSTARRSGCEALRDRLDHIEPLLHVFGHIHEDGGAWVRGQTLVSNVTTWEAERRPSVFDVNVEARKVVPVVIPPAR